MQYKIIDRIEKLGIIVIKNRYENYIKDLKYLYHIAKLYFKFINTNEDAKDLIDAKFSIILDKVNKDINAKVETEKALKNQSKRRIIKKKSLKKD